MRYCCAFAIAVWAMLHPAIAQIRFEEIARKAGLDFRLKNAAIWCASDWVRIRA